MKTIKRKYLDELINLIRTKDIKVITGIRRSEKSFLMNIFKEHIFSTMDHANVVDIDFTLLDNE